MDYSSKERKGGDGGGGGGGEGNGGRAKTRANCTRREGSRGRERLYTRTHNTTDGREGTVIRN